MQWVFKTARVFWDPVKDILFSRRKCKKWCARAISFQCLFHTLLNWTIEDTNNFAFCQIFFCKKRSQIFTEEQLHQSCGQNKSIHSKIDYFGMINTSNLSKEEECSFSWCPEIFYVALHAFLFVRKWSIRK